MDAQDKAIVALEVIREVALRYHENAKTAHAALETAPGTGPREWVQYGHDMLNYAQLVDMCTRAIAEVTA